MTKKCTDIREMDLADFKETEGGKNASCPLCPARWVMHSQAGICDGCPMKGSNGPLDSMCGLPHMTVDHPYRVVDKGDGETRHFIAYPYHTNLEDMEAIVKMCKAHPGLQVDIQNVKDGHGRSYRLDFYYSEHLAREEYAAKDVEHGTAGGAKLYAAVCDCYDPSKQDSRFKPYIFWRRSPIVSESDMLGVYNMKKTANKELVKHAKRIVHKMNRNAAMLGIDHASFTEYKPGYIEVFAEYDRENQVKWSSAYILHVEACDFNKALPEDAK